MKLAKTLKTTAVLLACLLSGATRAGVVQNSIDHFDLEVIIDCDGDGTPEDVLELSGDLHALITETDTKSGVITTGHFQPVNVTAVGLLTGTVYNAVGLTRSTDVVSGDNETFTFVNDFYMIGRNSGIKSLFQEVFHVTVLNGDVVVLLDHLSSRCL